MKNADFSKGFSFVVAAVTPVIVAFYLGNLYTGIPMALGVLLCSPSDVPGSLRSRITGIALSMGAAVFATLLAGSTGKYPVLFIPILLILLFGFSMISVYGFRASLISFSGLFAVVLSMAKLPSDTSLLVHALLIGAGGLWYLLFTVFVHYLNPRKETGTFLAEGFDLTADYLDITGRLVGNSQDDKVKLKKELFNLQATINEKHETIRELVISRRRNSGRSAAAQKELLILMELVDILELGMANPVNFKKMETMREQYPAELEVFGEWNAAMARQLKMIGSCVKNHSRYVSDPVLEELREKAGHVVLSLHENPSQERSVFPVVQNLYDFKEKQLEKIKAIERLLIERKDKAEPVLRKEAVKFLTTRDYDLKTLQDNLDFKSPIFRHSIRLAVVMLTGFVLGILFEFQNAYWILLTSLVIMRPGYALTRERFKQRLYGTLIGGAIAASIVLLTQNTVVYGILALISLVLAFSMLQKNYKAAAAFITLNVIFLYSLLTPNAFAVIWFRVLDTVIGAGLAFLGNSFLWPTWEYKGINNFIKESLKSNQDYINEIQACYSSNESRPTSYKLARKEAFLAIGNLHAAFQRMTQEPRSEQKDLEKNFEIISLNQELLSSAASLGTFIRSHLTTPASVHFRNYMEKIQDNLSAAVEALEKNSGKPARVDKKVAQADAYFQEKLQELAELRHEKQEKGKVELNPGVQARLQEAQIVTDQLKWLLEISANLRELVLAGTRG